MVIAMYMAEEYAFDVPKDFPGATRVAQIVTEQAGQLTPRTLTNVQQQATFSRNLDEGRRDFGVAKR